MGDAHQQGRNCVHQSSDSYHQDMEPVMNELLTLFWNKTANFKDHVQCIERHMKRFRENGKPQVAEALKILGFNVFCCHYGDQLKEELKQTNLSEWHDYRPDKDQFSCFLESLKCYSDIKKNKLGSVEKQLKALGQETICKDDVPCESTGFYWRTMGSYHLQSSWAATTKEPYKHSAKECFNKCLNHFHKLSERNPWCQYLMLLYVKAMATIICLHLKMCWFLFDPLSIQTRFVRHIPEVRGIEEALRCFTLVRQELAKVKKGSIWEHHLQYQLLLIEVLCRCRQVQYICLNKENWGDVTIASEDLITLCRELNGNYNNGTNSQILEKLSNLAEHWHRKYQEMRATTQVSMMCDVPSQPTQKSPGSDITSGLSELDISSSCHSDSQMEDIL